MANPPSRSTGRKSTLTEPQQALVELLKQVWFGRIEGLHFEAGQPRFDPAPSVVEQRKMGPERSPFRPSDTGDFQLKEAVIQLFDDVSSLGPGDTATIEVRHGLPSLLEIRRVLRVRSQG